MHFTQAELKEIHDGLITLFGKKDSDIESLEGTPNASDTVVIMHNNINKKTTVGNLIGHDGPLAPVATTGNYNDLNNKPTIPAAQVKADWNAQSGVAQILNKPTIPAEQVNSNWSETNPNNKSYIINKPNLSIYEASYIPFTEEIVTEEYITEHSKLKLDINYKNICHSVILQTPENFNNYNLTSYIDYYIKILSNSESSIIKLYFTSFWDEENTTYFNTEDIKVTLSLYGKFEQITDNIYQILSPKSKKTKCCIMIMNTDDSYDIICECLGSEINQINN